MRNGKKNVKRKVAVLLATVSVLMLTACGMKSEDAKAYAQGVLDASYKGEFELYMEQTDATKKEAQEMYENNVDEGMATAGFQDMGMSKELEAQYRQMFLDMLKQANYELGEPKEEGKKEYAIDITIEPFVGFDGLEDEMQQRIEADIEAMEAPPSESEINDMVFQKMYEIMCERVANPTYGEPEVVTIHVKRDDEGVYHIPEEELKEVDEKLFP